MFDLFGKKNGNLFKYICVRLNAYEKSNILKFLKEIINEQFLKN